MGSGYRNMFVCVEYCATPLCPFDPLPSYSPPPPLTHTHTLEVCGGWGAGYGELWGKVEWGGDWGQVGGGCGEGGGLQSVDAVCHK